jgi:anti-sigma factor RsiW
MTCRQLIEFLADYLDGALPADQRAAFERHVGACRACADYLATYRETIRVTRAVAATTGRCNPPPMPDDLVRAITTAATCDTHRPS